MFAFFWVLCDLHVCVSGFVWTVWRSFSLSWLAVNSILGVQTNETTDTYFFKRYLNIFWYYREKKKMMISYLLELCMFSSCNLRASNTLAVEDNAYLQKSACAVAWAISACGLFILLSREQKRSGEYHRNFCHVIFEVVCRMRSCLRKEQDKPAVNWNIACVSRFLYP